MLHLTAFVFIVFQKVYLFHWIIWTLDDGNGWEAANLSFRLPKMRKFLLIFPFWSRSFSRFTVPWLTLILVSFFSVSYLQYDISFLGELFHFSVHSAEVYSLLTISNFCFILSAFYMVFWPSDRLFQYQVRKIFYSMRKYFGNGKHRKKMKWNSYIDKVQRPTIQWLLLGLHTKKWNDKNKLKIIARANERTGWKRECKRNFGRKKENLFTSYPSNSCLRCKKKKNIPWILYW